MTKPEAQLLAQVAGHTRYFTFILSCDYDKGEWTIWTSHQNGHHTSRWYDYRSCLTYLATHDNLAEIQQLDCREKNWPENLDELNNEQLSKLMHGEEIDHP